MPDYACPIEDIWEILVSDISRSPDFRQKLHEGFEFIKLGRILTPKSLCSSGDA